MSSNENHQVSVPENGQPSLDDMEENESESQSEPESDHDFDSAQDVTSTLLSYNSYAEYLVGLTAQSVYPGPPRPRPGYLNWLNVFFTDPDPTPPTDKTDTFVLHTKHGKLHRYKARDAPDLARILRPRPALGQVQTRVIIVSYMHTWGLNRSIVDMLALRFRLHPLRLYRILYNEHSWMEKYRPRPGGTSRDLLGWTPNPFTITLPGDRHIVFTTKGEMCNVSAVETHEPNLDKSPKRTLLIFVKSITMLRTGALELTQFYPMPLKITTLQITDYLDILNSLDESAIKNADQSPTDFLLPFARVFASEFSQYLHQIALLPQAGPRTLEISTQRNEGFQNDTRGVLNGRWKILQHQYWAFVCCHNSLKLFAPSPAQDQVAADYAYLEKVFVDTRHELRDEIHRRDILISLEVSEQSIKESQSVRRLTQLAFVFIPLTFVTSCFGMNLDILSSGSAQLSTFLTSALSVTAGVLVLSSSYTHRLLGYLFNQTKPIRALAKLSYYFPSHAFWLVCLGIRYPWTGVLSFTLYNTNVYYRLLEPESGRQNRVFMESTHHGSFWNDQARELFDIFQYSFWDKEPAWHKLYERLKEWVKDKISSRKTTNTATEEVELG